MKTKAVFLDRDGVINFEQGNYITNLADFKILPHAFEAMSVLKKNEFLLIVITNQGGIAKEFYSKDVLNNIHEYLNVELSKNNLKLDDIYFCPHHPEKSNCICRKPDSVLIEKALSKFNIDPSQSFFIGDKDRDIECAEKAGVKGILIEQNTNWIDIAKSIVNS